MIRILFAVFFAFILLPLPAKAQETGPAAIGTIAEVEGVALVFAADAANAPGKPAAVGNPVYLNDIVETGPASKLLILFTDDTEFTLGENARLTIDDYVFESEGASGNRARFSALNGAFVMVSGLIGKNKNPDVEIRTAYGAIGLRGTVVWGGTIDDAYNIFVQQGRVKVSTSRGQVTVGEGEGTTIQNERSIPARAKAWGQEKIKRATDTVALKDKEGVKARVAEIKGRHHEMRAKKQEERGEKIQEKKEEKKSELLDKKEEKKAELQEKREGKKEELRGGDTAPEHERREREHIRGSGTPPRGFR